MALKLRSQNPLSTPLTWTEMDANLSYLSNTLSGSAVSIMGITNITDNVSITGSLVVSSTLDINNTSSFNQINPKLDITYDLGKSNTRWNNGYIKNLVTTNITASSISGSITNATSASIALSSSYAISSSYIKNAVSSSYSLTSSNAITASYSLISSNALSASGIIGGTTNYLPYWVNSTQLTSSVASQSGSIISINGNLNNGNNSNPNIIYSSYSHTEGYINTINVGADYSHAEGARTIINSPYGHTEGWFTLVGGGDASHAEGYYTTASGDYCHAEGANTQAKGNATHAEGFGTISAGNYQHAGGRYNIEDSSNQTLLVIGNGTAANRSDAFKVRMSGSIVIATGSSAPNWVGQEGEIKPIKNGSALLLYCYINGAWHSASLA